MMLDGFRPDMDLMADGIAVRLVSFAETIEGIDYWWVTLLFVEPRQLMMAFSRHKTYSKIHQNFATGGQS